MKIVCQADYNFKSKVDESLDNTPMPSEGVPVLMADIPDETCPEVLPASRVCRWCGATNLSDSTFCNKCGYSLTACPNCGHQPEEGMSFCVKCGKDGLTNIFITLQSTITALGHPREDKRDTGSDTQDPD